ncbi:hypothetical protein YC2023_063643 [Brassica napus]
MVGLKAFKTIWKIKVKIVQLWKQYCPGPYARRFDGSHPLQLRRSAFLLLKQIFSSVMLLMRTAPAPSRFRPPPDPPPCGRFHGSLQLQPSSSVSNFKKQLSSPMAPVVTASSPSPLHLPPPLLRLRLPPDPPPPWSSATVPFESISPPEPPDPPDASLSLVIHRLFDTPFTLSQASFNIPNLASDGVVSLVFVDGTIFGSKCLYPAVCSAIFSRLVVWRRHCSSLTCVGSLTLPFILVCLLSSSSVCSLVEWSERFVVYVAPDLSVMDLVYNVPMNFVSFGSTSMPVDGSQVALVRSSTAVCSLLSVFSPALGAVISCYLSWWQIEGKLVGTLIPVNRVMEEFHYPMDSFVEQFLFPIFPSMWSELDGQASLVLQGSSSWLMLFSAFVAVFVTFEVTRYAIIQEDYEIFRFFMVSCDVFLLVCGEKEEEEEKHARVVCNGRRMSG